MITYALHGILVGQVRITKKEIYMSHYIFSSYLCLVFVTKYCNIWRQSYMIKKKLIRYLM